LDTIYITEEANLKILPKADVGAIAPAIHYTGRAISLPGPRAGAPRCLRVGCLRIPAGEVNKRLYIHMSL
jgi:hypothetical protein